LNKINAFIGLSRTSQKMDGIQTKKTETNFIKRRGINDVAQDKDKRRVIMNTVINMWFLHYAGEFLDG
jgi:hypothetical protein